MKCERCRGIMVSEEFYSPDGEMFSGWRCIFCGEIVDPVILRNRKIQKTRPIPSDLLGHPLEILPVSDVPTLGMPE